MENKGKRIEAHRSSSAESFAWLSLCVNTYQNQPEISRELVENPPEKHPRISRKSVGNRCSLVVLLRDEVLVPRDVVAAQILRVPAPAVVRTRVTKIHEKIHEKYTK